MTRFMLVLASLWCCHVAGLDARPLAPAEVPEDLQPWVDWALRGSEDRVCPFSYQAPEQRRCAWPSRLELALKDRDGAFRITWRVLAESWVELPGSSDAWPQDAVVDGKPAVVTERDGRPGLSLAPGTHRVVGRLLWDRLPTSLPVPRGSGIVELSVNGRQIPNPPFNEQGQLWIEGTEQQRSAELAAENRLELQVFRRIVDDAPLSVVTRVDIDASGQAREILLDGLLLDDFIPQELDSPLPARLEPDGRLRLQLRPGRWQIAFTARHPGPVPSLALRATTTEPWPSRELWAFDGQPSIRVVEVEGVPAVDPQQTNLPEAWRHLPTYQVGPGEVMSFRVLRRGDSDPEPDTLSLERTLWLDFDGGGYTLNDRISGRMTRDWRLNVSPELQLGRVTVDGVPQLITQLDEAGGIGVEVRRGQLQLAADSRVAQRPSFLPATGWDKDFQSARVELNLPPGWRLLSVSGVDNAPDTWVSRWTLLDLFLVLIATLAVARLWNWPRAALALAALALLWHEPGAPTLAWLNLLAATALLRVLPAGRVAKAFRFYRNLVLLGIVLISLPFSVAQIRLGLYPQLEFPWLSPVQPPQVGGAELESDAAMSMADAPRPAMAPPPAAPAARGALRKLEGAYGSGAADYSASRFDQIDPSAVTQTGPGLPQWRWRTVSLGWNGPVAKGQSFRLFLLSPGVNLGLNMARVGLLLGLLFVLSGFDRGTGFRRGSRSGGAVAMTSVAGIALLFGTSLLSVPEARADFPDEKLLQTLRERLLAAPDCLPACADIALLRLKLSPGELEQRLEIHAAERLAIPLPAHEGQWLPTRVSVDGTPAEELIRTEAGELWLGLNPGRHEVVLVGAMPQREQIQLPLGLKPRRVERDGTGWSVQGVGDNGVPEAQLQLSRELAAPAADGVSTLEPRPLPSFLEVRRTLQFGLDWRISTMVQRRSPAELPVVAEIPLIDGESVTTPGIAARNGKVAVNLPAGPASVRWDSILERRPAVTLTAPQTTAWIEVWLVDASPIWHVRSEGIPVAHQADVNGNWLPEWRPWPGETVSLRLQRPQAVSGSSLTLESSRMQVTPGIRALDASLTLSILSSQGGQHGVNLPEGAVLQSVSIDGKNQPIRQQGRVVSLPIHPGSQSLVLNWRQGDGIGSRFLVPEVNVGMSGVNAFSTVSLGADRWVLLTGGPRLGPAVLFWGILAVILLLSAALGRSGATPLLTRHWSLLLVGLSQISLVGGACVVGWLFVLAWRWRKGESLDDSRFNALQLGLALLTLVALGFLFAAVEQGLLGMPDMQVAGNQSDAQQLNWYLDHSADSLPQPWVISVPLWAYRLLMLAWALWLAYALLNWLRWGWQCYTRGGFWRPRPKKAPPAATGPGSS